MSRSTTIDTRKWARLAGVMAVWALCIPMAAGQGSQAPPSPTIGATAGPGGSDVLMPDEDSDPGLDPLSGASPDVNGESRSGELDLAGGVSIGDGEETIPIITKKLERLTDDMLIETFPLTDLAPSENDDGETDVDVDLTIAGRSGMRFAVFVGPDRETPAILLAMGELNGDGKFIVPVVLPAELFDMPANVIAPWTVFIYRMEGDWVAASSGSPLESGPAEKQSVIGQDARRPLAPL
jgi:hypothetical protein